MSEEQSKYNHEVNPLTLTESEQLIKDEKQYINGPSAPQSIKDMFDKPNEPLIELARDLKLMKEKQKAMKDDLAEITTEAAAMEAQLYDLMIENNMQGIKLNGKSLSPNLQRWASIPADLENSGFEQLEELGLGSLIKRKVNTQTLSAEMRTRIDDGSLVKRTVADQDVWVYTEGPLKGMAADLRIAEIKKIGMRKV